MDYNNTFYNNQPCSDAQKTTNRPNGYDKPSELNCQLIKQYFSSCPIKALQHICDVLDLTSPEYETIYADDSIKCVKVTCLGATFYGDYGDVADEFEARQQAAQSAINHRRGDLVQRLLSSNVAWIFTYIDEDEQINGTHGEYTGEDDHGGKNHAAQKKAAHPKQTVQSIYARARRNFNHENDALDFDRFIATRRSNIDTYTHINTWFKHHVVCPDFERVFGVLRSRFTSTLNLIYDLSFDKQSAINLPDGTIPVYYDMGCFAPPAPFQDVVDLLGNNLDMNPVINVIPQHDAHDAVVADAAPEAEAPILQAVAPVHDADLQPAVQFEQPLQRDVQIVPVVVEAPVVHIPLFPYHLIRFRRPVIRIKCEPISFEDRLKQQHSYLFEHDGVCKFLGRDVHQEIPVIPAVFDTLTNRYREFRINNKGFNFLKELNIVTKNLRHIDRNVPVKKISNLQFVVQPRKLQTTKLLSSIKMLSSIVGIYCLTKIFVTLAYNFSLNKSRNLANLSKNIFSDASTALVNPMTAAVSLPLVGALCYDGLTIVKRSMSNLLSHASSWVTRKAINLQSDIDRPVDVDRPARLRTLYALFQVISHKHASMIPVENVSEVYHSCTITEAVVRPFIKPIVPLFDKLPALTAMNKLINACTKVSSTFDPSYIDIQSGRQDNGVVQFEYTDLGVIRTPNSAPKRFESHSYAPNILPNQYHKWREVRSIPVKLTVLGRNIIDYNMILGSEEFTADHSVYSELVDSRVKTCVDYEASREYILAKFSRSTNFLPDLNTPVGSDAHRNGCRVACAMGMYIVQQNLNKSLDF
jgi:hypothetical protein